MPCDNCGNITLPTGSNGLNGYNAFTVTTASFVLPAVGASVTIAVSASGQYTGIWAILGQIVYISDGVDAEYFEVTTAGTQTAMGVKNLGYVGTTVGNAFGIGSKVSPAGLRGAAGAGTSGTSLLGVSHAAHETTLNVYTNLFTPISITAGLLNTDGDSVEIEAYFYTKTITGTSTFANIKILVGGISVTLNPVTSLEPSLDSSVQPSMKIRLVITRTSVTLASVRAEIQKFPKIGTGSYADETVMGTYTPIVQIFEILNTGAITWANANDITFQGKVASASNQAVKCGFYKIVNLQI